MPELPATSPFTVSGTRQRHTLPCLVWTCVAVAKILGHKDLKMTLRYAHLAPDFLQGAVERLDFSADTVEERQDEV